ncbi:Phosphatidylinositol N-acetylglucosaminyltransferase GPI3 subunit [Binucleata daphniae]
MKNDKLRIAMACDYFYPNIGGIETHIEQLAIHLQKLGCHVIVITHKYTKAGNKMLNKIPVYYLNIPTIAMNTSFPNLMSNFYALKKIFDKECIDIVHGHQTMSNLALEAVFHAKTMGLKTCFTEHSVFEKGGFENIIVNRLAELILRGTDRFICVSYTSKENLMCRLDLESKDVFVIPNAVVSNVFYPDKKNKTKNKQHNNNIRKNTGDDVKDRLRIVVVSRLVGRKGIDILIDIIPVICILHKNIEFVIAGDGPKRDEIEQMIDINNLKPRIKMIGELEHEKIADILRTGDIFLNVSLTEAFCMAILEAASCGLYIVSTNVGGVNEVLPHKNIILTNLTKDDVVKGLNRCIANVYSNKNTEKKGNSCDISKIIKDVYNWENIAKKTHKLYTSIKTKKMAYKDRIKQYSSVSEFVCRLFIFAEYLQHKILLWLCK